MERTFDRATVLAGITGRGREVVAPYTSAVDWWLAELFGAHFGDPGGVALVATGGHGRSELTPGSDLDLILLHDGSVDPDAARSFWYPIWDSGMKLGHAVRTPTETLALARNDLATATTVLSVRCLAGDTSLSDELAAAAARQWSRSAGRVLAELAEVVRARHSASGDVAFALEPELKEGRGGLRDVLAIEWASAATEGADRTLPDGLADAYGVLLDTRVELHRCTTRAGNRLTLQDQDDVAVRLGDADADVLMSRLAAAGRAIGWASDEFWADVLAGPRSGRLRRGTTTVAHGHGIRSAAGRATLDAGEPPDALAVLRLAVVAAGRELRIDRAALDALSGAPELSDPWPAEALRLFVELLGCGHRAVSVIESLDHAGLWTRLLPEWEPTRSRPQRNAYHRFTVDRHLLEATANAAELVHRVQRPDLLLLGTLLHDIGKGYPGEHTVVGRDVARSACTRMGLGESDVETVERLVALHLLLPDVATRRDLDDPVTIRSVAAQARDTGTLGLLWALTEADASATGPAAWSPWKAELVAELVARTGRFMDDGDPGTVAGAPSVAAAPAVPGDHPALIARCRREHGPVLAVDGDRLTVVAPDRPGLFSRIAGVLALHGLDVIEANARNEGGLAVDEFRVMGSFDRPIPSERIERDLDRALRGRLAIESRLSERARSYHRRPTSARALEPTVRVLPDASEDSTVVEVVGPDSIGLLFRLTRTLSDLDLDIASAKVATLSADVVDAFYVRTADGAKITDPADVAEIRTALLHVLSR